MKYDVLCADTVDALIRAVNDKLKKGWKLQGGIANLIIKIIKESVSNEGIYRWS